MATTLESRKVKDHFADICDSIPASDVTTFAGELLQTDLICVASHRAAIEGGTGLPSTSNKISSLVSEVMTRVAGSLDKFFRFVSILESRNKELAEILGRKHASYETDHESTGRRQHSAGHELRKETQLNCQASIMFPPLSCTH